MIEQLAGFPPTVIALAASGRVSKHDYDTVLVPTVENAIRQHDAVRIFYRIGADFVGFDPGALWADFKVGIAHPLRWERIAVITDVPWIGHAVAAFRFLIHGEMRVFPLKEGDAARAWIVGP
jgi:hypothetical protein